MRPKIKRKTEKMFIVDSILFIFYSWSLRHFQTMILSLKFIYTAFSWNLPQLSDNSSKAILQLAICFPVFLVSVQHPFGEDGICRNLHL